MTKSQTFLGVAVLVVFYYIVLITYRLFFHPLAKVPGPKLLAISSLPKGIRHSWFGLWYTDVGALHEKYGRVFRMSPNEVAVDGDPGWEDVFSFRRNGKEDFQRDPHFFDTSINGEDPGSSIFFTDRAGHSRQRRILSHAFSQSAMYEQEPLIKKYVDLFILRMSEHAAAGKAMDIHNFTTFDIIGDLTFGESFDCLSKSEMHPWVAVIFASVRASDLVTFFKSYMITRPFINALLGKKLAAQRSEHKAFAVDRAQRRTRLGAEGTGQKDFMWHIMKHNESGKNGMSPREIEMNSEVLIGAGSETTATCLSGIAYYLGRHPEIFQKLVDEVRPKFTSDDEITMKSTADLKYVFACIEESLRMFPPVLVLPPRLSPGDFIGDYFIPKNTKVSLHQYATYHSPKNWHRPNEFCPERFLPQDHPLYDESFAKDNKKSFNPFSHGPANCIGKNLAYAELRLIVTRFVWNFDILPQPGNETWVADMRGYILWDKPPLMTKLAIAKH
ncbi:cytochrome P450 [Ampelomyces quisqualis]|uniref:Cytochrome P450 n=1 Tax=Ampelomyces quisqualis TaxID=50730 RepID=A0A6A5QL61_AMPQU|nr:cytochrome P450 [Ampelomyces quisqualis]